MPRNLYSIQEKYFEILKDYFGPFYNYMKKKNIRFDEAFRRIYNNITYAECQTLLESISEDLDDLWKNNSDFILTEVKKIYGIKTYYFWGSTIASRFVNPEENKAIINKQGLYTDTILIDDPLMRTSKMARNYDILYRTFQAFSQSAGLLKAENLILADVDTPIALIIPTSVIPPPDIIKQSYQAITEKLLKLLSDIFNKEFDDEEDIKKFLSDNINSLDDVDILLSKTNAKYSTVVNQIKEVWKLKLWGSKYVTDPSLPEIVADAVYQSFGGFINMGPALASGATKWDSYLLFDSKSFYDGIAQSLEYDGKYINQCTPPEKHLDTTISHIISQSDFKWLGNIPDDLLITMRNNGELMDYRNLFKDCLYPQREINEENFERVSKEINYNLKQLFIKHEKEIESIKEKYSKKLPNQLASLSLTAYLAIFSAIYPPLEVIAPLVGGGNLLSIYNEYKKKCNKIEELSKKPVGILFDAHSKNCTSYDNNV